MLQTLSLVAALLAFPATAELEWAPFTPADTSFRVDLPGKPEIETRERWFPASSLVSTVYKVRRDGDIFGVNHTDLPGAILFVTSNRYILKSTREGFLESSAATEIAFEKSELDGLPAHRLLYAIPAGEDHPAQRGTAMMLFVDKRLFIFYAEMDERSDPKQAESQAQRFFRSIHFPSGK